MTELIDVEQATRVAMEAATEIFACLLRNNYDAERELADRSARKIAEGGRDLAVTYGRFLLHGHPNAPELSFELRVSCVKQDVVFLRSLVVAEKMGTIVMPLNSVSDYFLKKEVWLRLLRRSEVAHELMETIAHQPASIAPFSPPTF